MKEERHLRVGGLWLVLSWLVPILLVLSWLVFFFGFIHVEFPCAFVIERLKGLWRFVT